MDTFGTRILLHIRKRQLLCLAQTPLMTSPWINLCHACKDSCILAPTCLPRSSSSFESSLHPRPRPRPRPHCLSATLQEQVIYFANLVTISSCFLEHHCLWWSPWGRLFLKIHLRFILWSPFLYQSFFSFPPQHSPPPPFLPLESHNILVILFLKDDRQERDIFLIFFFLP